MKKSKKDILHKKLKKIYQKEQTAVLPNKKCVSPFQKCCLRGKENNTKEMKRKRTRNSTKYVVLQGGGETRQKKTKGEPSPYLFLFFCYLFDFENLILLDRKGI